MNTRRFPFKEDGRSIEYLTETAVFCRLVKHPIRENCRNGKAEEETPPELELIPVGQDGRPLIHFSGKGFKEFEKGVYVYTDGDSLKFHSTDFSMIGYEKRTIGYEN